MLVVPGQRDELIISSNVLKYLIHALKSNVDYWKLTSAGSNHSLTDCKHFLDMMSCTTRWRGEEIPDKIGSIKLPCAVTLLPQKEHLVWGKLSSKAPISPGSTIIVEPCTSKSRPRDVLVGRVITPMWGDRWLPLKITNLSSSPTVLKRNSLIAEASPCIAVEDFNLQQGSCRVETETTKQVCESAPTVANLKTRLSKLGLNDLMTILTLVTQVSNQRQSLWNSLSSMKISSPGTHSTVVKRRGSSTVSI